MLTLHRVRSGDVHKDAWLAAVQDAYFVPAHASVFAGVVEETDERVAFWIAPDGSGFGAIDNNPEEFVKFHNDPDNYDGFYPGVDEHEFDPGTYDPNADTIEEETRRDF